MFLFDQFSLHRKLETFGRRVKKTPCIIIPIHTMQGILSTQSSSLWYIYFHLFSRSAFDQYCHWGCHMSVLLLPLINGLPTFECKIISTVLLIIVIASPGKYQHSFANCSVVRELCGIFCPEKFKNHISDCILLLKYL